MPTYCYRSDDGECKELIISSKEKDEREVIEDGMRVIYIDKKKYKRDYTTEKMGFDTYPGNWPLKSQSMGCALNQIDEMEAYARSQGVDLQYDRKTGAAICKDKRHWKDVMKLNHMHDKDAYY